MNLVLPFRPKPGPTRIVVLHTLDDDEGTLRGNMVESDAEAVALLLDMAEATEDEIELHSWSQMALDQLTRALTEERVGHSFEAVPFERYMRRPKRQTNVLRELEPAERERIKLIAEERTFREQTAAAKAARLQAAMNPAPPPPAAPPSVLNPAMRPTRGPTWKPALPSRRVSSAAHMRAMLAQHERTLKPELPPVPNFSSIYPEPPRFEAVREIWSEIKLVKPKIFTIPPLPPLPKTHSHLFASLEQEPPKPVEKPVGKLKALSMRAVSYLPESLAILALSKINSSHVAMLVACLSMAYGVQQFTDRYRALKDFEYNQLEFSVLKSQFEVAEQLAAHAREADKRLLGVRRADLKMTLPTSSVFDIPAYNPLRKYN